jgi:hypothetical protein
MVPAGFRNQEIKSGKKEKRQIARMEGCLKPSTSSQVTVSPLPAREKLRIREENSLRNREENWGALESWSPGVFRPSPTEWLQGTEKYSDPCEASFWTELLASYLFSKTHKFSTGAQSHWSRSSLSCVWETEAWRVGVGDCVQGDLAAEPASYIPKSEL